MFREIVEYLRPGDLLIANRSRVIPARLVGTKEATETPVEMLLLRPAAGSSGMDDWEVLLKPARRLRHGSRVIFGARELVASGVVSKVDAHNMVKGGRLVSRTTPFLVSPGILPADAARLGFTAFPSAQAAIDAAIKLKEDRARVVILGMGGEIAPIVTRTS